MKLLTAQQIRDWDHFTIRNGRISSLQLTERAASNCVEKILTFIDRHPEYETVSVFCGPGNNGGDGLVVARKLKQQQQEVQVFLVGGNNHSADFQANLQLLQKDIPVVIIGSETDMPEPSARTLVVDAIYGTGLNRAPGGLVAQTIDSINNSDAFVIAIDMPSGLTAEVLDIETIAGWSIIEADITYTFQVPKLSFLHAECYSYTGEIEVIDIGLLPEFLTTITSDFELVTTELVQSILKPRPRFSHKGMFGHSLIVAGSYGKLGAAILTSRAALRVGSGLVTTFVPKVGFTVLQTALPEVMVATDDELFEIRNFPDAGSCTALGIGPGMGTLEYTEKGFGSWLRQIHQPVVLDADGLNLCASLMKKNSSFRFPQQCILTPHPKEFDRLAGISHTTFERQQKQQAFAKQHQVIVVLKGANTGIAMPDGRFFYNGSGNPALATAGSGDVLTGIITGLLAQQYTPEDAAVFGVYLHGLCADLWMNQHNKTMIAGDIIEMIPRALHRLFN